MIKCDICSRDAIIFIRYNGRHLCEKHFISFFERRVRKEMREQLGRFSGTISVGLSGGKDSSVLLFLMKKLLGKNKDINIVAITVDEGIRGYREKTLAAAQKLCSDLGIEHKIVRFEDIIGITIDEVSRSEREYSPCTYCGVWRRKALNIVSKSIGAKYLALGTNLDDYSQTILMNFVRGDIAKLAKLAPHTQRVIEGMIPRIVPLRVIPEKENALYAILNNVPHDSSICPYANLAMRNDFRSFISRMEFKSPGIRHSIVKSYLQIRPKLYEIYPPSKLNPCVSCGEPTSGTICKACQLAERYLSARQNF